MTVMVFFVGMCLGALGALLCIRYLRQEVAADIAPGFAGFSCSLRA
jgi:hypothetical protein